ncbi:hypothetical protein AVEN_255180-1 [Araneus ventricosus]|uniref:Uncharacterized protein n=1 Tax=Araneus ventricosus TaxID=182803 RepID=A0A4Y2B9J8_ARAVE|nr:hypothetical protein AVEN_255180-1 [Araneus ventricosus]
MDETGVGFRFISTRHAYIGAATNFPTKVREVGPLNPVRPGRMGEDLPSAFNLSCKLAACCGRESQFYQRRSHCEVSHIFQGTFLGAELKGLMCTLLHAGERHIIVI